MNFLNKIITVFSKDKEINLELPEIPQDTTNIFPTTGTNESKCVYSETAKYNYELEKQVKELRTYITGQKSVIESLIQEVDLIKNNKTITTKNDKIVSVITNSKECKTSGENSTAIGKLCTADGAQSLALGRSSKTKYIGQIAHSSMAYSKAGDAQGNIFTAGILTSDDKLTELFLDGVKTRLIVQPNTTMTFNILVAAHTNKHNGAGYNYMGTVCRDNKNNIQVLPGFKEKQFEQEELKPCDVKLEIDNKTYSVSIKVKGLKATNIRWFAVIQCVEVNFDNA